MKMTYMLSFFVFALLTGFKLATESTLYSLKPNLQSTSFLFSNVGTSMHILIAGYLNCSPHLTHDLPRRLVILLNTLNSLPVFSLAESLQLVLEISVTYRLVSYLLAD